MIMRFSKKIWLRQINDQMGQGTLEYALIVSLISLAAMLALTSIGSSTVNFLSKVVSAF